MKRNGTAGCGLRRVLVGTCGGLVALALWAAAAGCESAPAASQGRPAAAAAPASAARAAAGHGGADAAPAVSADEAWRRLADGNRRYVDGKSTHPNDTTDRRTEVAKGQHPFAIVLACADSRVGPELVFDAGLGDLFVVRVAGNVSDDTVLASIEYAAEHLHVPLVVVLGHERCGAVSAAVDAVKSGGPVPQHIDALVTAIRPAVEKVKGDGGDVVDHAVSANARLVADHLRTSEPVLGKLVKEGKLKVVAARYDLDTGEVTVLE
jgi:carbonic anhydrase